MQHRNASKAGATCAIAGAALLLVGTYLHPMEANPNEPVAAFTEYAADDFWVFSHLMQLAGVASMVAALLFLTTVLETRRGPGIARVAAGGAIASLALAATLQAVDGRPQEHGGCLGRSASIAEGGSLSRGLCGSADRGWIGQHANSIIRSHGIAVRSSSDRRSHLSSMVCGAHHGVGHPYDCFGCGDGTFRLLWALHGDQYAGECHPSGMDAHPWSSHVASRRSFYR
jgi:hypothetical protein